MLRPTILLALTLITFPAHAQTLHARLHRTITGHDAVPRRLAFSPDATILATSSADRTVKLWRVSDGTLLRTLRHPEGITSVAFSRDGQWLVAGSYDATVSIWRMRDFALARRPRGHTGVVWSVAFSPDGQVVASSGEDKTIRLWRARDGALLHILRGHSLNVWSIAFSPDGKHLVSSSFDRTARIWRTDSGRLERTLAGHGQAIVGVAYSPNGQLIATGSDDSTIRLWRASDGAVVKTLTGSDHVYTVAFSPDGTWLASGGRERGAIGTFWKKITGGRFAGDPGTTVRLWRVRDGALQQELAGHTDDVFSVAFSSDGKWLATASEDGSVKLWRLA